MKTYTHKDKDGVPWRFENGRPISKLADEVVEEVFGKEKVDDQTKANRQTHPSRPVR
jgi:hypothetical protein